MVKVRVRGLPGEVADFVDALERAGVVVERSEAYPDRRPSRYVRVYADCEPRPASVASEGRRLP